MGIGVKYDTILGTIRERDTPIIQDEGVVVSNNGKVLNFIGAGVRAVSPGSEVQIYIPSIDFVSHFNTEDGANDARVTDHATFNRAIANSTIVGSPFDFGDWFPGTFHDCLNDGILTYTPTDSCSFVDLTSTFEVRVYDADDTSILTSFTTTAIGSDSVFSGNDITVTISNLIVNLTKYQGDISIDVGIGSIIPRGGRFSVELIHHNAGDGDFTKTQGPMFFDDEPLTASIGSVDCAENTAAVVTKQLSGVYYYTLNSMFEIDISDIDNLNAISYPLAQVNARGTDFGLPDLNIAGSDLTGWSNDWDDTNDSYNKTNWAITQENYYALLASGSITARYIDWEYGTNTISFGSSIAVDTYTDNATRIYEDFRSETYRVGSDLLIPWESGSDLNTYQTGSGLQLRGSRIIYPSVDYGTYDPVSGSQPDYTTMTGSLYFYRSMWHDNINHSNGRFQLGDYNITEADIANDDIEFWISLNGSDWYTLNDDYIGGVLTNGDGCRVNSDIYNIPDNNQLAFTFGAGLFTDATTGSDGWGMWIQLILKDNVISKAKYIGTLQEVTWV